MTPKSIFEEKIASRVADESQQEALKAIDAVYQFHVTGDDGGDWIIDLRECTVGAGTNDDADCSITLASEDLIGLLDGSVNGTQLFMTGRLQVSGNMALALKLGDVLKA